MNSPSRAPHRSTLLDLLTQRASETPDQRLYTFLDDAGAEEATLTFAGLEQRARRIAVALQQVAAPGERVMLLYPPGLDYVTGFFGCLYAGLIAVPAYPPDPSRLGRTLPRLQAIIDDAQAKVVLTTSFIASMGEFLFEQAPELRALHWLATDELAAGTEDAWRRPVLESGTLAFLQYTSGSTGTPKGVMLSHANLLNNLELISHAFQARADSVGVIWLPPYHDMGLIGGILEPLYKGMHTALLSPLSFLKTPLRWLEAISRYGGTISGGPNFAFDLCVRRISPEERATLDLRSWEVAFCGAEPIRVDTLDRFVDAFGPCGFRREAIYPCYGLAEGTLIASGGPQGRAPLQRSLDAAALERNQVAPAQEGKPAHQMVSCGQSLPGHELLIVEPTSRTRHAEGSVGEVWLSGPSVAQGYWRRPEESTLTFLAHTADGQGPFLRTGDLGVFQDGELFITGRLKDLIIIRGRNHYPQDIELTVEKSHPALRPGCVAAFAVEQAGEERLVVVHEVDQRKLREPIESLVATVRQRVAELHEVQLHALVLIEPGSIFKTSSGKIQRRACRTGFVEGSLQVVHAWSLAEGASTAGQPEAPVAPEDLTTRQGIESWMQGWISARLRVARQELGVTEPLTRFGLDSLASVELSHEVERTLGMKLPLQLLLQGPTIAELASHLFSNRTRDVNAKPSRRAHTGESPLSFAQQRLWFLDQLEPGSPLYNIPAAVRLEGTLDVSALERAFAELVHRHESLRTTFVEAGGTPVQKIAPSLDITVSVERLAQYPAAEHEARVEHLAREEARRPFDLARGPLLRVKLLQLGETQHVLVLTMHHIISDGWSMGVLIREVAALYRAFASGQPAPLAELPLQYADYAAWQREWLWGETLESQLTYWRQQLAEAPQALELPTDKARPAVQSYRGASQPVRLPADLSRAINTLAQREGATPFMVLLAAFNAVLSRYSGQQDLTVGTPIAGRAHAGTEGLIGFFANTLVLRTRLEGNPSFRELLGRARQTALDAYAHQDVPFEKLVEELKPQRDLSRSPFFQVMLALRQDPLPDLELPGITSTRELAVETLTSKFDLTLSLVDSEQGFTGSLEYNTDLFEQATAARLVGHLQVLLEAATASPELSLSALPLLSAPERQQVLVDWNATQADYAQDACLHHLVEAQVARTPDATALVAGDVRLTYRELNARANRLAHYLRRLGVGPEVRVGVCLERSELLPTALLAILKAGGTYVPLDPAYPRERLAFMLQDASGGLLLTQSHLADALGLSASSLLRLDTDAHLFAAEPDSNPVSPVGADNLAYLIYTSGSTGRPKGVALQHRGAVVFLHWALGVFSREELAGTLAATSICFDLSVFELFAPLSCGGAVVLARDALHLAELPAASEVTLVNTVPSAMAHLVRLGAVPASVLTVNLAGEALSGALVRQVYQSTGVQRLYNLYGPSEDTTYSTFALMRREEASPPIGRPLANTQAYVLDAQWQPVPVGVPGELYLSGLGLARGYLGRPELTAERFLPNPFATGARMYRTGDKVRLLADGTLEYLGRLDHQVKVRGFRIELGELDAVLAQHPAVQDVLTLAREDVPGDKRLVAYLVARPGQSVDVAELRAFLARQVPEYMVPSAFVALSALPLSPNGKVDRKALPAPEASRSETRAFVAPRNPTEQLLASLWSQVLGVERVGSGDHFFELGGHSLLATQVVSRVRAAFRVELPLRVLFEAPTLEALALKIDTSLRSGQGGQLPALRPVARTDALPLSFAQQRLWFLEQLEPGLATYNMAASVQLEGTLDVSALERGFQALVQRHESLRTTFRATEKEPVQVIHAEVALPLPVIDLAGLPQAEREAEERRLAREEAQRPFDLIRGPLLRLKLLKLEDTRHVLLLTMHHIVADGWSMGVLVREVGALYDAFSSGRSSPLPALSVQYADYAAWQRDWLQGEALETQLAYWRQQLAHAPKVLELPTDKPRPPVQSFRGATLTRLMPRTVSDALTALCQREGTTPFMALLAGFQTLLSRYSGQTDIVVGTDIAGRTHADTEGLIGFFINQLVMRGDLSGDPTFRELLGRARHTALGAYAHQDVPFEELVRELNPERSLAHAPLFQVKLVLQNAPTSEVRLPGLTVRSAESGTGAAKFDLTLAIHETAEGLSCLCEYSTDLYEADTIARMFDHLQVLLEAAASHPEQRLSALPLLSESERQQVLVGWNDVRAEYPRDALAHQLFEAQAQRTPDAVAVQMGEDSLTYRQLDARANQLAHHLLSLGVGPDVRVGLCVERSLHMVVGLLGILKAGGAYVPLDPSYPAERLAFMLRDSLTPILLTQEHLADELPVQSELLVLLDAEWDTFIAAQPESSPQAPVLPEHLAYVIYTSGSTGTPKGTLLHHRGLCNTGLATASAHGFHPGSRVLQFAASSFDASVCEVFSTLLAGACLVLASREDILPGAPLLSLLTSQRVSAVTLTPSVLSQLEPQQLPGLETLISAGETCSPELLARWAPGRSFLNAYGPTEVTICASITGALQPGQPLSIGRPLPNVQLFVLDAHLHPVPVGVPGELFVAGPGLARGYLGRPELTAERFVPNPFASHGERLYRTGDKVRRLADGQLEFLGRLDSQVKLRGFRIELGEVENALRAHASVHQAAVVLREDSGHKRLVAYLVPASGQSLDSSALHQHLKARLPEYMVPSAFVPLSALPLTSSGKLDVAALPALDGERPSLGKPYAEPRNDVERRLAAVWSELLGIERVGIHDDFFELGGDSIIAIQVIARARQKGLELNPKQLFQNQTIAALAAVVGSAQSAGEQGPVQGLVPLTPIQRAFFEWNLPAPHHYNQPVLLELREPVEASRLEQALSRLVEHHDALRMRFVQKDGGWEQTNAGVERTVSVRCVDLSGVPETERAEALESAAAEVQRGLDLSEGLLLRAALMDLGPGRTGRLLLAAHHLVVDAVSWRILLEDLGTAYAQLSRGESVLLPPKSTSFQAWAQRLNDYARSPVVEQELDTWLRSAPSTARLPMDEPSGANTVASARELTVSLDATETRALLQELPTAYRTQINDVLLTALAQSLRQWSGGNRLTVDLEGHGREDLFEGVDLSRTVGWFTSLYPVQLELPETAGPVEQLRAVRHQLRQVPGRGIGYGLLRYLRQDTAERLRALSAAEVSFNYLGQLDNAAPEASAFALAPERGGPARDERGLRSHLIEVNSRVQDGCLRLTWTYSANLHRPATLQAVAEGFLTALRTLIAQRHSPEAQRYTPYDFPLARVEQRTLDRILPAGARVEDLYPLSPMQQGQLFQSLLDPNRSVYFVQTFWRFHSALDVPAFRKAWETVVERHAILRTAFLWEGLEEPLQLVHAKVELPWREHDWRAHTEAERPALLEAFLAEDRARGFQLSRAPLMRMAVLRMEDNVYQVVCSNHHLLLDGWSLGVLFKELLPLYDAFTQGQTLGLERPTPFRDYIAWQRRQELSRAESFWRRTLEGFTAPTPLPADAAPGLPESEWKELGDRELRLAPAATTALQSFARQHQLTLNTLVQAAWAVVLAQYSGEQDVLFGVTVSGRPAELSGVESMLGLFINSLPLRVRVSPAEPMLAWLQGLQTQQVELRQYEHSPLVQVQGWSEVPRGTQLFDSLMVFENYPIDASVRQQAQHMDVRDFQAVERFTFPLGLTVVPGQELLLKLSAKAPRFDAASVDRLLVQLRTVLEQMAARPEQHVGELTLLGPAERQQVLVAWNETGTDYPRDTCVHTLVEAQARRAPEALAIGSASGTLSFDALDRRANQLAHHLRMLGVDRGALAGVCLPRSPDMVVALLAILKAGGAYVPLDPSYPMERLSFMVRDAGISVLVTLTDIADELPSQGEQLFCMDTDWDMVSANPEEAPERTTGAEDLAYVIYTSGSTGQPKGVEIRHSGLMNLVTWHQRAYAVTPEDRATQLAGVAFDASVWELWPYLTAGASIHMPSEDVRAMPSRLVEWLASEKITLSFLPTPLAEAVLQETWPEDMALRVLLTGGDRLSRRPSRALRTRLVNHYGPTESTVVASCAPVAPEGEERGLPPIGTPISNTRVYLLDRDLRPVGIGVPGELFIGGESLAVGYLRRPELTAERFIPNPFSTQPGARLYRTGDKARYLADGRIEYLERIDFQVKVRGFRIELGEIEEALVRHNSVKQAVVLVREDVPGDKRLVAYVVPRPGLDLDALELRKHLQGKLPEYMVPAAFVNMEALPLTANGKVDRKALPPPDGASEVREHVFVAPRTPSEELLANVWKQVLNVERVGIHDDFFELGGHSLFATQVISRIRTVFGVELPLNNLFEARTVAELTLLVEQAVRGSKGLEAPPLVPVSRDGALRLSFAQQRLWFLDQMDPGNASFNISAAVRLKGTLDEAALEQAFHALVQRQEVLRTTFQSGEDGPVQIVHPAEPLPLHSVDLRTLNAHVREETARRLAGEEALKPFDLARGPLFRVSLMRLSEQEHLLLLTMHHIVSDGWSTGPLIREVAALYQAFASGEPSPLPELPVQYADFAAWQRGWLRDEALETQLAYWRQQLAGAPQVIELPADHARPAVQSSRGAHLRAVMPRRVAEALEALGREEGSSLFMALLAGFQTLLHRYSGETDVVVGTDIANRTRAETEGLIGFFVNQLVMRGDLSGDPTFRELLGRVRHTALEAYARQDVPFEELVRELNPERSLAHAPLFQVKLILQNAPETTLELPGLTLSHVEGEDSGTSKLDMTLSFTRTAQGLACSWEYSTDLYEADTIARMFDHLQVLLEAAAAHPDQRLSALPLLSESERRRILVDWNDTRLELPQDVLAHQLFEAQAARTPDAIAVQMGEESLTYRQLDARANQLAHHLLSLGVGPDVRVGLCVERSLHMVVGLLGILKAGGAYVPLDPSYPAERLAFMLRDSLTPILLTQEHLADELPVQSELLVLLDAEWDSFIASQPESAPHAPVLPEHLAYVIYTSGSTGTPKGTLLHHRGLCNTALASIHTHQLSPADRVLQFAAFSFDTSVSDFFRTLLSGARLVLATREQILPGPVLHELMEAQGVTAAILTPSVLAQLEPDQLPSLRTLISAGEACTPQLVERWQPGRRFLNEYGPTEITVCATIDTEVSAQRLTIGRAIPNAQLFVLDARLQPVPVGVPGELFIGGPGLARGYHGRPELTAEKFVPHPFSASGERLYRTGDKVRWLPDGRLDFLGRLDSQVKLRGFRIELGEVENALRAHPAVQQAVALVREDAPGDKRLVGYLVPHPGQSLDIAEARALAKEKLPEHMVPSAFVLLEALPLTPSRKVDLKALPPPGAQLLDAGDGYLAPRTPTEELLAAQWSQLLGVARVGLQDNFFELGGHSLLATQVISRIRATFGVDLPINELFESPTVAGIALALQARLSGAGHQAPPLLPVPRTGELPLSFAQQRLWFLEQLEPGQATYNLPLAMELEGELDVAALERGFQELVRRHEALRTTFRATDAEAVQVIHSEVSLSLPVIDLSTVSETERQDEARRLAHEESGRPFDLIRGPLFRVKLLKLEETRHVLLLTMHHIVSDGWSMGILVKEVAALYQAFTTGQPSPLPELPVQYADFAAWQRGWLRDEALEAQLAYWREHLTGAPQVLELPTDRPRPAVQTYRGASHSVALPEALSRAITTLGQQEGTTPFMVLLAAFNAVLSRYSGQQDISVGSPIAGRTHADTEGLIGFFVNTLVLRTRMEGNPSFRELLGRVRQATLGAYAHQDIPFEKLVEELKPQRSQSYSPLFQVMFAFQNAPATTGSSASALTLRPLESANQTARFDLILSLADAPEGFRGTIDYNVDLFDTSTVGRLFDHMRVLLEAATAHPDQRLSALPMLTEAERQQVLVGWNDVRAEYPRDALAHQLFEAQAARTPDALAVQMGEETLTYRQLDARANQLAHHLRSLGVGPEVRVGLCIERSFHMVVGLLGILKAGGAYVPLDPAYPRERLAFMVKDSAVPLLLTQQALRDVLPLDGQRVLCLDTDGSAISAQPESAPDAPVLPEHLAYVIYTSGSTGTPKGTLLHHRGLCNTGLATASAHGFHPGSRVLQFAASSFDASVCEVFSTLLAGACLVLASREDILPGAPLLSLLTSQRVSAVTLTPSVLSQLEPQQLPGLETLISAGEACSPELLARWAPGRSFLNAYGPTEVTICASITGALQPGQPLSIGRPLPNVQLFVLDAHLHPVPVGVPGELFVAGPGLARGYLGRPELTAERFVPNPFASTGERLYRTGDKVRRLADGQLEFLGRLDSQVKLRGFRIELGEVENALRAHASVHQAAVVLREDAGHKRLVAYLVPTSGQSLDSSALHQHLKARLPEYMVPSAFVPLSALPLTSSGKLDVAALPALDGERPTLGKPYVEPRNDVEQQLAALWAELLGITRVGIHDDFFELGGHSLLATQIVSRIRRDFGVELPLRQLFDEPTVANLAEQIVTAQASGIDADELERLMAEMEAEDASSETPSDSQDKRLKEAANNE
ncbi:non-ribosomal peptide synthase/polyketide synthase [Archangium primigenium]|uniref:non-ribosomal peptide synthase/polyketide synthase n=1 Tax=[Archangium] primigenium TaxID=2792470 RepID=UPI001959E966|nr:non-ribosomal peptide synthase/polyketide synthase [Archangium primigenium]MBM7114700.1 non-ribosomal peptide synthase/polyketide synthase [Archangium primigenium]